MLLSGEGADMKDEKGDFNFFCIVLFLLRNVWSIWKGGQFNYLLGKCELKLQEEEKRTHSKMLVHSYQYG